MSKSEEEVLRISKKFEKIIANNSSNPGQALDLLKILDSLPITLEVLQKTRIGMTVNALRKSSTDEEVITLSKSLIKNWKKLLSAGSKGEGDKKEEGSPRSNGNNKKSPSSPSNKPSASSFKQASFPTDTNNSIRIKCRDLLSEALKKGEMIEMPEGSKDLEELAAIIEDHIYLEFNDVNMKYKNRVRSRVANLKDTKNPNLRINVLQGTISPERIASMSAEEMASDEMRKLRKHYTEEAINDHQMAVTSGTKTELLKCGKCKKNNCSYNQVQTRSSDEPMTTFVFCNECGNRWKFC